MRLCLCLIIGACMTSIGSGQGKEVVCYGDDFSMPTKLIKNRTLYFTPTNPIGPSRMVMHKGKVMDQRYEHHFNTTLYASNVTEKDYGSFSISYNERLVPLFKLSVSDCAIKEDKYYGEKISMRIFRNASILSFSPLDKPDKLSVLWRRNGRGIHEVGKGKVEQGYWVIDQVTQKDTGYYNFRTNEGKMSQRYRVTVSANSSIIHKYTGEDLIIDIPLRRDSVTMDFYRDDSYDAREVQIIRNGQLRIHDENVYLADTENTQFVIESLYLEKSGTYMVRDSTGNLVCKFELIVDAPPQTLGISSIVSAVGLVVSCCCCYYCCGKCCCGEDSAKLDSPACETPEPAVCYQDENGLSPTPLPTYTAKLRSGTIISGLTNHSQPSGSVYPGQPSCPTNPGQPSVPTNPGQSSGPVSSGQPSGPVYPGQPLGPTPSGGEVFDPASASVFPIQPTTTYLGPLSTTGEDAAPTLSLGYDCLSHNSGYQFELKGKNAPSVPSLSSDTHSCDVYTSSKLIFR